MNNTSSPAQIYQTAKTLNPAEDPSKEPVKQCCGYTLAVLFVLSSIGNTVAEFKNVGRTEVKAEKIFYVISAVVYFVPAIFFFNTLRCPSYLAGKPPKSKFWPFFLGIILNIVALIVASTTTKMSIMDFGKTIGGQLIAYLLLIFIYGMDDSSDSCCLCFKPWIYKTKMIPVYHPQGQMMPYGYPPQGQMMPGGYPPQAYQAPMAGPYPPQAQNVPQV